MKITDEQYQIILACKKTMLKDNESMWIKTGSDDFHVPMGGYNSTQIIALMGWYILDTLSRIADSIQLGLYRDDGIWYIPNNDGPKCSSIQKTITRVFKFLGFKIKISSNI